MKNRARKKNYNKEELSENSLNKFKTKEKSYSINQKDDILSNNNIYSDDNKYSLNRFLAFNPEYEENYKEFYYKLYINNNFSYILVSIYYFRFLYNKISNYKDIFQLKYIINIHIISYILTLYYIYKYKKKYDINKHNFFIKILFDFNHSIYFYKLCKYSYDNINLLAEIFFNNSFILIINFPFYYIIISEIIIFIIFYLNSLNSFSYNIFKEFLASFSLSFFLFYNIKKSIKKNWILYDSFKNSLPIINNLFLKNNPNPIIIMNKNNNIIYSNKTAKNLIKNSSKNKPSSNKVNINIGNNLKKKPVEKNSQNFENLLHPNLKDYFFTKFKNIIENKYIESFYFPFFLVKEYDNDIFNKSSNNLPIDFDFQNCIWYNVIVKECIWKNQDCYFVNLISCSECYNNNLFNNILKQIIDNYDNYINNIDNICDIILKSEKIFNFFYDNNCININSNNYDNINRNSFSNIYDGDGNNINLKNINSTPKLKNKHLFLFNKSDSIKNFVSPRNAISNLNNLLIGNNERKNINNLFNDLDINYFPDFDYTILFFFKNQTEKLCDLVLGKEIYFSLLFQKLYRENNNNYINNFFIEEEEEKKHNFMKKSIVNIPLLCDYFYHYFFDTLIEKNFSLKFLIMDNIKDIYIEERILRTLIFNTLLFIISNTNNYINEKNILVNINKIKKKKNNKKKDTNDNSNDNNEILYFEFNINEKNSLNNNKKSNFFADINTLLKNQHKYFYILNVYYLITSYYYKDFNIISKKNDYQINFELTYNNIKNKEGLSNHNYKYCVNEEYFKKVMKEIYKIKKLEKKENIILSQNKKNIFKLKRHQSFYGNNNKNFYDDENQKNNSSDNESKVHNKSLFFQKSLDDKDKEFSKIKTRKSLFNYENKHTIFNENEKKSINKNFSKLKSENYSVHNNFDNDYIFNKENENEEKILFYNMKVKIKTFSNNKEIGFKEDDIYNPFLSFEKKNEVDSFDNNNEKNENDSFDNNNEKNKLYFYKNILEEFKPKKRIKIIEDDMQLLKNLKRNVIYYNKDILIETNNNLYLAFKDIKNKHKKGEIYSLIFISINNILLKNGKNIFQSIKDLQKAQKNKSKLVCLVNNESKEIDNLKNMFDFMLKIPYKNEELKLILSQINI